VPKTTESGDFIIEWKGMKFMFENKTHKKTVPKTDREKAIRDFELNPDCDVLIFVSEDSRIVNCKRYFDITRIKDGRPAIWIGEFNHNLDKVIHLQLVGQVAEELVLSQQREKKLESGDEIVN
jgi:bifunctional DNA-binding transcriptional regulator/antitoxin component of YhaV-PrlF toxin-antitoxin module